MTFLLDTNTISFLLKGDSVVSAHRDLAIQNGHVLLIAQPVVYEVLRGLIKAGASRQLQRFQSDYLAVYATAVLIEADWAQAAQFWADATNSGKQLSDADLLLAALASRLNATIRPC